MTRKKVVNPSTTKEPGEPGVALTRKISAFTPYWAKLATRAAARIASDTQANLVSERARSRRNRSVIKTAMAPMSRIVSGKKSWKSRAEITRLSYLTKGA